MLNVCSTMQLWSKSDDARHRIWSLYAMLKATADTYMSMCVVLSKLGSLPKLSLDADSVNVVKTLIANCKIALNDLGIDILDDYVERITTCLDFGKYEQAKIKIGELSDIVRSTLSSCLFVRLDNAAKEYYEQEKLFGSEVYTKFPDSRNDIVEAGNCYALDRFTASVFHTMRAVEQAAKKIYNSDVLKKAMIKNRIEFSDRDTLGTIARNITHAAKRMQPGSIREKLHKSATHLTNITEAERNPTMHTSVVYSGKEAKLILDNAREFMVALCGLS